MALVEETLPVRGMTCTQCEANLQTSLAELPGVETSAPDFRRQVVTVSFDPGQVTMDQIREQIREAGYET